MNLKHGFSSESELKNTLDFIYSQSKEGKNFHGLIEIAFNEITIVTAVHNIKSNKGANTAGIDKVKIDKYLQMDKDELIHLIQKQIQNYKPKPVKRHYIEKSNGKLRPLGIPTILERIIQECLRMVLEPIVEAKFYPQSYGFRPYRATKNAVKEVTHLMSVKCNIKPVIALEGDITSYFDNINHKILLKKLWKIGIHDKRVLAIIKKMLTAGYMEKELKYDTKAGTIQGGIISPLLANVYLNDFDWMIGTMYHYPKSNKNKDYARELLRKQGINPKFLIRYADDWITLTTTKTEAERLYKYLTKYFRHRLKLELSKEKTVITDLRENHATFLGFNIRAGYSRSLPNVLKSYDSKYIIGKSYPDMEKIKKKVKSINAELKLLRKMHSTQDKASHIEKVNSMITGLCEYHKVSICSKAFGYIDNRITKCAYATFKRMYGKKYKEYLVPLNKLSNRPNRHKGYISKTFAVRHNNMYIGITKAFLTHSQWEKYPLNQLITPYSEQGRKLYLNQLKYKKNLPLDRPPLYDLETLYHSKDANLNNFEFYMNREYAFNRDKGKCKVCGKFLIKGNRHCHRIEGKLPIDKTNKVPNLAWLCHECDKYIHENTEPINTESKIIKRIQKYQLKLYS